MISATRSLTVAFRISLEERALIDAQAFALRVSNSEYSRRAVVGAARVDAQARAEAQESGREEIRLQLAGLRAQLAHAQGRAGEWRREAQRLHEELSQWSDDVVAAVKDVLAGDAAAQVKLATIWSRVLYGQRLKLLPIVAALVSSEFEQIARGSRINKETRHLCAPFLERVLWLIEALDRDAGEGYSVRTKDGPLEKVFTRIAREVGHRLEGLERGSNATAAADDASVDDGGLGCSNVGDGLPAASRDLRL